MLDSWLEKGKNHSMTSSPGQMNTIDERYSDGKKMKNLIENSNMSLII